MQANVELHMKIKHPDGQAEQFECDFEGKVFKNKVKCNFCDKKLKFNSMKLHLKNFHVTGQNFQCKICSKFFKSSHNLTYHEKSHNKAHKCDICFRMFSFASKLNKHKKNHVNPKSFGYEICGMKFNRKQHLSNHQKTHVKNRLKSFK